MALALESALVPWAYPAWLLQSNLARGPVGELVALRGGRTSRKGHQRHDAYRLLMSRDDAVCRHMLQLYNNDVQTYGHVDYARHPEFTAITWQGGKYTVVNLEGGRTWREGGEFAIFDINNDNKEELVFKKEAPYRNLSGDQFFVFADTSLDFAHGIEFTAQEVWKFKGIISRKYWSYDIDITKISKKLLTKYHKKYHGISLFTLHPFLWNKKYYIGMEIVHGDTFSGKITYKYPKNAPQWLIIVKYSDEHIQISEYETTSKLEHICYMDKITK